MRGRHPDSESTRRHARRGTALVRALGPAAMLVAVALRPWPARAEATGAVTAATAPVAGERGAPRAPAALELHVSYLAPSGCPSGVELLAALQAHLAEGGDGAVDAVVRITEPHTGAFELELELHVAGMQTTSRARADSCRALMELAALDASMARTPSALGAVTAVTVAYMPSVASREPSPAPGLDEGSAALDGAGAARTSEGQASPHGFVLAEMRAASGMLPGAAWGQGLALGASLDPWSLRLSGTWWVPGQLIYSGDGGSPIALRFEQQSLELSPCAAHALAPALRIEACLSLSLHRTQTSAAQHDVWGALGGALLGVLHPWRGLRVEAAAQLVVPLSPPSFAVGTLEDVYRSSALQPGARLALGWEFGAGREP